MKIMYHFITIHSHFHSKLCYCAVAGYNAVSLMLLFMLQYLEEEVQCNKNLPVFAYAIGDEASKFSALAVYSLNDGNGYLNKLQAGNTGKYTFIHVGTSDGKLMKVVHL